MIAVSRWAALIAFVLAVALHAGPLVMNNPVEEVQIEGGAGATAAALGSSFADMVQGELQPDAPDTPVEPDTPEAVEPDTPDQTDPVEPLETATPDEPEPVEQVDPQNTAPDQTAIKAEQPDVDQTPTPLPEAIGLAVLPPRAESPPEVKPAEVVPPTAPIKPEPKEVLKPKPEVQKPVAKPKPKPKPVAKKPAPKKKTVKTQAKAKPKPKGNSNVNAKKGTAAGTAKKGGASKGNAKRSKKAGNAAVSNYKGKVFRKISRARRGKVNVRGAALISLTISPNGQLASVRVARSSGSGKLDQVALSQVRRAAPFGPTPTGKSQTFSVRIKGAK